MDFTDAELIVFDLDYTLIDSSEGIVYCFNEARRRSGEPEVDPAKLKPRIGLPIEEGFQVFGSADPKAMRDLFRKIATEGAMRERSFLLPGVEATLPALREKGYKLAVASTKSRPEIVSILEHLGVAGNFMEYVGSDEVDNPKPAPDPLYLMMEKTGMKRDKMVYVGDHVVDIRSARSAGVRVIAVEGGPIAKEDVEAEGPDAMISEIGNIISLF